MQRKILSLQEIRKELADLMANEEKRVQRISSYDLPKLILLREALGKDFSILHHAFKIVYPKGVNVGKTYESIIQKYNKKFNRASLSSEQRDELEELIEKFNQVDYMLTQQKEILEKNQSYESILQEAVAKKEASGSLDEQESKIRTLAPSEKVALEVLQRHEDIMDSLKEANRLIEEKDKQIANQSSLIQTMGDESKKLQADCASMSQQLSQLKSSYDQLNVNFQRKSKTCADLEKEVAVGKKEVKEIPGYYLTKFSR